MPRIHVVKRNDDNSDPRIVGWFNSEDAQVFTRSHAATDGDLCGGSGLAPRCPGPQRSCSGGQPRAGSVMALEFGPPLGTEYQFVAEAEASAWPE